jgi:hypothetical protein
LWLLKPLLLLLLKTHIYPNFDVEGEKESSSTEQKNISRVLKKPVLPARKS